jgi:hypothetical protein
MLPRRLLPLAAVVVSLLLAAGPGAARSVTPSGAPGLLGAGFHAAVTWGGTDVASASSLSSALVTTFSHTIDVRFTWQSLGLGGGVVGAPYTINDARLQMFYFGLALATRDVEITNPQPATNGSFDMQWDPGILQWVLEGTFGLTASLLAPNGTTMWTENFFIHAAAPYSLAAAIPLLLILIGAYEVYSILVSGRQSRPPARPPRGAKGPARPEPASSSPDSEGEGTDPGGPSEPTTGSEGAS